MTGNGNSMKKNKRVRPMKCNILFMFVVILLVISQITGADPGPMVLFYTGAATYNAPDASGSVGTSNEALPIGNGKLAAMIYGGTATEIIQFNEDTVWSGKPNNYTHAGAVNVLELIRQHVWAGQGLSAYADASGSFMSVPLRQCPYQPTAELRLTFNHSSPSNYRRQLDLTTATASVSYQNGGVTYSRDCFASYPDNVIVVRLAASGSGNLSFTCALTTPHTVMSNSVSGNDVVLHGAVDHVGVNGLASNIEFETRVRLLCEGGSVATVGNSLQVSGANAVTLVLGAASNFVHYDDISGNPSQLCLQTVTNAAAKGFTALRQDQLNDYQSLFNRVSLDLGTSNKTSNPTNVRLDAIEAGVDKAKTNWSLFDADDLQFVALNFQMARYLMIAGSRPGSQPLGLQGKWNNELEPSWEGKMTLNINEEMNYWGAEVANLAECHEPLFDMIRDLSETGVSVATQHYGAGGWMVHHNTDLWRGAAPINNAGGLWPTGGAWLSMHLWWHYEYSQDTAYLAEIYPIMKGAAQFFVDFLVTDTRSGRVPYLLTNPSHSPEQKNPALGDNGELVAGPTMDCQLIRGLFTYVIEASKILDVDAAFRQQLEQKRAQLPPNQIGSQGQLQEWLEDVDILPTDPIYAHRHMSHLVDLMPAGNITPIHTPQLAAAAEVVLDSKGDLTNNTSWSQAWKMCCRTRLLQGNHAYMILNKIFGKSHTDNMTFSRKGNENQIDGNLGILMGTAEMFLQSHQGEVYLLPALPDKMVTGSVTGLRARGGFEVDINWQNLALQTAEIQSLVGNTCRIRSAWPIAINEGTQYVAVQSPGENLYEFPTEAGHTYTVTAYSCTTPIPSDLNDDCQVNFIDFVILASEWIDGGSGFDLDDLAQLTIDWLQCNRNPGTACCQ
jgi:alpha-L-fucosidase 2